VYPIERLLRDPHLMMIWTGMNKAVNLILQHEDYKELLATQAQSRHVELDAVNAETEGKKIYE
jgi:hypothetical protein